MTASATAPLLSVVILNYNGRQWIQRCLESIRNQSIFDQLEVIVADNASVDASEKLAAEILAQWPQGRMLPLGANLGYCEGNNQAARAARGRWLFFLNNDTWLEADCLERLLREVESTQAHAATPLVLNWDDNDPQEGACALGFDLFGLPSFGSAVTQTAEVFMPAGCSYLIDRRLFEALGRFDAQLFMYADELDLSWRVWLSGHRAVATPAARLHHRGAAAVNPKGGARPVEFRTSDGKRFYANRNALLVLLKHAQHVLLLLVPLQLLLLAAESLVGWAIVRRWSFVRRTFGDVVRDCWRLRLHILAERQRTRALRRRSDWWMLRFLRCRPNRCEEIRRIARFGWPKVTAG